MITERYRTDYTGEFVVTQTVWAGGKKRSRREWIPNPIENKHISNRAVCIASPQVDIFDYTILQNHKGGLLGSKKLQTYGTGEVANTMNLDFVVETDQDILLNLLNQHYYKNSTIYTKSKQCLAYPGMFYVVPYMANLLKQAALPYLAAFDGHKEVFLLGYNEFAEIGRSDWQQQIYDIMATYRGTKFFHVDYESQTPDSWKSCANFAQLTHREFIIYCDV
jgi:hypothetical protein